MGGLAAAIRLAAAGFEVELFEKNGGVGGRVGRLEAEGFSFDTGPSLLLMTDTYRELFRCAGRDLDDYVRLIPLDANYRVTFGDGDALTIRRTLPELVRELERIEPGVTPNFYRFLEDACHKYRLGRSEFVERDFEGARDFFGVRNLRLLLKTAPRSCGRRSPCRRCTWASRPSRRRRSTRSSPTPSSPRTACGSPKAGCTPS
jgi:phytoene dehydrogenase-like protein